MDAKSGPGVNLVDLEEGKNLTTLQFLLKLAHSNDTDDQQKAAVELSKLVEGTVFPAVSFGPLAHALCRLIPSEHRTVASHAARAVKILLLDDALRPQAVVAGIPRVLVSALVFWEEEAPCLRELLGALQTLCWDKATVRATVDAGLMEPLLELLATTDLELRLLTMATVANVLAFSDTLFLTNKGCIDSLCEVLEDIMEGARSREKALRCYSVAAVSNASAHPVLAGRIKELGGLELMQDVERLNKANLNLGGTRLAECAATAITNLSGSSPELGSQPPRKYLFKWGNRPLVELTLDSQAHRLGLGLCFVLWLAFIVLLFRPLLLPTSMSA